MSLFRSIWEDLKYSLRAGKMVTKLAVVNFAVFVTIHLTYLLLWVFTGFMNSEFASDLHSKGLLWLYLPSDPKQLLWQPWSLFAHMFMHADFWHLFSNLVGLSIFGMIVGDLLGDRRVLPIYLMGGLAGAFVYIFSAQFNPTIAGHALGASAAVMALGGSALILAPDYRVPLLLLGGVKVKYIVLVLVLLDIVSVSHKYNSGGPAAHLAGFAMGCIIVFRLRDGKDWAASVNRMLDAIFGWFRSGRKMKVVAKRKPQPAFKATFGGAAKGNAASDNASGLSTQEKLDAILDKIKAQGFDSLSQEEKDFLYDESKRQ
jgi:membrane associated rhomboid family serine protease